MVDESMHNALKRPVRVLQIIIGALTAGVLCFGTFVYILAGEEVRDDPGERDRSFVFTYVVLGLAGVNLVLSILLPRILAAHRRRSLIAGDLPDPGRSLVARLGPGSWEVLGSAAPLADTYVTGSIVGAACVEGAALMAVVAYLLEGGVIPLVLAGVLVLAILSFMPTVERLGRWLAHQLELVERGRRH